MELRENVPSEFFCSVPFTTLILNAEGSVCVCRNLGRDKTIGNIKDSSLEEMWNNEIIRSWRREFLTGNIVTCKQTIQDRKCHLHTLSNEMIPTLKMSEYQEFPMVKLTANFNGLCNLECPMCDVWKLPNDLYSGNFFDKAVDSIFPHLKAIDFYSGEPFIQKDTYRMINEISAVNPECEWGFVTNCQWNLNPAIKKALSKIKIVEISMSIDSVIPETYTYLRKNGRLGDALATVIGLRDFIRNEHPLKYPTAIAMNMTVQRANWREIPEFIRYCKSIQVKAEIWPLKEPSELSIYSLPENEKYEILEFWFANLEDFELLNSSQVVMTMINSIQSILDKKKYLWRYADIVGTQGCEA